MALKGAGPEPGKDVVPIGRKEIPIPGPGNACARRPAPTAQYLSSSKPRLRIVFIGVGAKSGKRREVGGRPLPNISDHLPATECTVAARASRNIKRSIERKVEIGTIAR